MMLFDKYTRTDAARFNTIYLEQEPIPGRERKRYACQPRVEGGKAVLVDAYSVEAAYLIYEREFQIQCVGAYLA